MAKLVTAPTRYTHEDWSRSNLTKYANADVERQQAERLIAESDRLKGETARRTEKTQEDVNKKLGNFFFTSFSLHCQSTSNKLFGL